MVHVVIGMVDAHRYFGVHQLLDVRPKVVHFVIVCDDTGEVVKKISAERPEVPIFACLSDELRARQLRLSWGVFPFARSEKKQGLDDAIKTLLKQRKLKRKNRVIAISTDEEDVRIEIRTI